MIKQYEHYEGTNRKNKPLVIKPSKKMKLIFLMIVKLKLNLKLSL